LPIFLLFQLVPVYLSRQTIFQKKRFKMSHIPDLKITPELMRHCTIGVLRQSLTYKSREAMQRQWSVTFPGQMLPPDHETVEPADAWQFINELTEPKRGRPGSITTAAQTLKRLVSKKVAPVPVVPENIEPAPGDVSENIETSVPNFSETSTPEKPVVPDVLPNITDRLIAWACGLTKLDVVYFFTIAVADYGLTYILREMGAVAAIVYTLISLDALGMAKNRYQQQTARSGIIAVWALEIGAFFIHLTMFNRRLWDAVADLPFRIDDVTDESRPFYIALTLSVLLSAAGIYAVSITLSKVLEQTEAENFEQQHGVKY